MLAVDVGGTTIKAEVVDGHGNVVASGAAQTPYGGEALVATRQLGHRLIEQAGQESDSPVSRACVIVPGLVDRSRGIGTLSANIGWHNLDLVSPLENAWKMPVLLDHDVTIAGWAEWQCGAGRGCDDMFFVALGTGVAAAIVAGGHLLRGGLGQGGEFGHVIVRPGGPRCGCGSHGCVEALCSAASIVRGYRELSGRQVSGAADVLELVPSDPVARWVWESALAALGDGLISVVNLLSPARIVVGGGLAEAKDALTRPLYDAMHGLAGLVPVPAIVGAEHGTRAGLVGAALLAQRGTVED